MKFALAFFSLSLTYPVFASTTTTTTTNEATIARKDSSQRLIVMLDPEYSHDHVEHFMGISLADASKSPMEIHHRYSDLVHGMAVSGVSEEDLRKHPGVLRVVKDSIISIYPGERNGTVSAFKSVRSWGLDRINQPNLPLDSAYSPTYKGKGVDVYVVDTGLDTTHVEFAANPSGRKVQFIYATPGLTFGVDPDGHGTHVAGTVGGNTAGVSPSANIYGVRVLDDSGSGYTSDIVAALEYIGGRHTSSRKSIVNMSLGGPCDTSNCADDPLNIATNALVGKGVVVVVAAGNDNDNACYGSPNSAASAITVAASDKYDDAPYYTNYGSCVDIIAPGDDIESACAISNCGDRTSYQVLSGTSMASPHVAGVAAQIMEMSSSSTPAQVIQALTCLAAVGKMSGFTSNTPNLLVQIPRLRDPCVFWATSRPSTRSPSKPSAKPSSAYPSTRSPSRPTAAPSRRPSINPSKTPTKIPYSRRTNKPSRTPTVSVFNTYVFRSMYTGGNFCLYFKGEGWYFRFNSCDGSASQQFLYDANSQQIRPSSADYLCLRIISNPLEGSNLEFVYCSDSDSQRFGISSIGEIYSLNIDVTQCLSHSGSSWYDDDYVYMQSCNQQFNQLFDAQLQ